MPAYLNFKLLLTIFACLLLIACGGGGGGGGGSSGTPGDNGNVLTPGGKGDGNAQAPVITLISITDNDFNPQTPVPESTARIRIATAGPVDRELPVRIGLTVEDNAEVLATVTIPAGESSILVALNELGIDLPDGAERVEITLSVKDNPDGDYTVNLSDSAPTTFSVEPAVTIRLATAFPIVAEDDSDEKITFTFTASNPVDANLTIRFTVEESGDMIAAEHEGDKTVTLPSGNTRVDHDIPLVNDNVEEPESRVAVTNVSVQGNYLISPESATVTVRDDFDGVPLIALTQVNDSANPISEIDVADRIRITTRNPLVREITAMVEIAVVGGSTETVPVTMPRGHREVPVPLTSILVDLADGATHELVIKILPDPGSVNFLVDARFGLFPLSYFVNTPVPAFSLSPGNLANNVHAENAVADRIKVMTPTPRTNDITVMFEITVDGSTHSASVVVPNGSSEAPVPLEDILAGLANSSTFQITVRIIPASSSSIYRVSANSTETYHVLTADPGVPELTISAVETQVTEGENVQAMFIIESNLDVKDTRYGRIAIGLDVPTFNTPETKRNYFEWGAFASIDELAIESGKQLQLSFDIVSDMTDEPDGIITLTLARGASYTVGSPNSATITIMDDDSSPTQPGSQHSAELHREILPSLSDTTSSHSMDSVSNRIDFAFNNPGRARLELNGESFPTEILRSGGEMANRGELTLENIMANSSFTMPLAQNETGVPMVLWGNGFKTDVSNDAYSRFEWEGNAAMGHLGFDATVGNGVLLGIASSANESSVDFELNEFAGRYDIRMTSLFPYLAWSNHDQSRRLKVSAGFGSGEVEIDFKDYHPETASSKQHSLLMGIREELHTFQSQAGIQAELAMDTEFRMARQFVRGNGKGITGASVGNRNFQTSIEGTIEQVFQSGSVLKPHASLETNWKGGDHEPGVDLDLTGGVKFSGSTGFGVSGSNHIQLFGGSDRVHELEGALNYDSNGDNLGLLMNSSLRYELNENYLTGNMEIGYGFTPANNVKLKLSGNDRSAAFGLNSAIEW